MLRVRSRSGAQAVTRSPFDALELYFTAEAGDPAYVAARQAWRALRRRLVGPTSPALEAAQRSTEHAACGAAIPVPE